MVGTKGQILSTRRARRNRGARVTRSLHVFNADRKESASGCKVTVANSTLAAVLLEGRKSANIKTGSGFILRISAYVICEKLRLLGKLRWKQMTFGL